MKIASVQMDSQLGAVEHNLNAMLAALHRSREAGAELMIFPECSLTGYCFDSLEEATPFAQQIPGPATDAFVTATQQHGGAAVFGLLEEFQGQIYNSAVLIDATGILGVYRKTHLPFMGVDRFVAPGNEGLQVFNLNGTRVGLIICYDSAFPETVRTLTLMGADLIALPTNFPTTAHGMLDHVMRTRAYENHVYFVCCNRTGEERGVVFPGKSQIISPSGEIIAQANGAAEEVIHAEVFPEIARKKTLTRVSGEIAIDRLADRRPELYSQLSAPHSFPRPGRSTPS